MNSELLVSHRAAAVEPCSVMKPDTEPGSAGLRWPRCAAYASPHCGPGGHWPVAACHQLNKEECSSGNTEFELLLLFFCYSVRWLFKWVSQHTQCLISSLNENANVRHMLRHSVFFLFKNVSWYHSLASNQTKNSLNFPYCLSIPCIRQEACMSENRANTGRICKLGKHRNSR